LSKKQRFPASQTFGESFSQSSLSGEARLFSLRSFAAATSFCRIRWLFVGSHSELRRPPPSAFFPPDFKPPFGDSDRFKGDTGPGETSPALLEKGEPKDILPLI
jgi:hypothetical protein